MNIPAKVGSNNPPSLIEFSEEVFDAIGRWLENYPVIETEDNARDAKLLVDRAGLHLADMEAERKSHTAPLNEQIKRINDKYREPRELLEKIRTELGRRLHAYIKKEEEKRLAAAAEARKAAEEAERRAREAEEREQNAKQDAQDGVVVDVGAITRDTDRAIRESQVLQRAAARAEVDTHVRIGGGFKRALSERTHVTLEITDPNAVLRTIGWTERVLKALQTEANEYHRITGEIPAGACEKIERRI